QDSRSHSGTRRLAVRCRDERGAERKPTGELVDGCRVELPEQLAGHSRATTRTGEAREAPRGARQEDLQPQGIAGSHGQETLSERPHETSRGGFSAFFGPLPLSGDLRSLPKKGDVA